MKNLGKGSGRRAAQLWRRPDRLGSVQELYVPVKGLLGHDMLQLAGPGQPPGVGARASDDYLAILEVGGVNYALLAPPEQEALILRFRALVTALQYPIQILVRVLPLDLAPYLARLAAQAAVRAAQSAVHATPAPTRPGLKQAFPPSASASENSSENPPGDPLAALVAAHRQHVQALVAQRGLLERRFYVVVPASDVTESLPALASPLLDGWRWLLGRVRHAGRGDERDLLALQRRELARQQLDLRCLELSRTLSAMGLPVRRLRDLDLLALVHGSLVPVRAREQPLEAEQLAALTVPTQARAPRSWLAHRTNRTLGAMGGPETLDGRDGLDGHSIPEARRLAARPIGSPQRHAPTNSSHDR